MITVPQRRLSFDCKTSKPVFTQQSDVISHTTSRDDMDKVRLYLFHCRYRLTSLYCYVDRMEGKIQLTFIELLDFRISKISSTYKSVNFEV